MDFPDALSSAHDRLQRRPAGRARWWTTARSRQRGPEAPQREPQDPRAARAARLGHVRAVPVFTGHSMGINARFREPFTQPGGRRAGRRPGGRAQRRSHATRRGGRQLHPRRTHPPRPHGARRPGLALFLSGDNPQGRRPQRDPDRRAPRRPLARGIHAPQLIRFVDVVSRGRAHGDGDAPELAPVPSDGLIAHGYTDEPVAQIGTGHCPLDPVVHPIRRGRRGHGDRDDEPIGAGVVRAVGERHLAGDRTTVRIVVTIGGGQDVPVGAFVWHHTDHGAPSGVVTFAGCVIEVQGSEARRRPRR